MQIKPTLFRKSKCKIITSKLEDAVLQVAFNKEKRNGSGNLGQFYKHVNARMANKSGVAPLKDRTGHLTVDAERLSYSIILL